MARVQGDEELLGDDALLEEQAFLAAVANIESQHLGRLTNVLSYDGSRLSGNYYGGGIPDDNVGVKRSYTWEEQAVYGQSGQVPRGGENGSTEGYSVDEVRKKTRTEEEDRRSNWPASSSWGQENDAGNQSMTSQPEGEYMAALRGSNSELWQTSAVGRAAVPSFPDRGGTLGNGGAGGSVRSGGSGSCYKCGMEGHWAKECTGGGRVAGSPLNQGRTVGQEPPNVPERLCACGAGICTVLTANTEKNQGRNFYKCPLRKDEGQCSFFEWCDAGGQSVPAERGNWQAVSQQPRLECKCGGGPCATLTAKTEKNMGRQFYKCPLPQGQACSFFQWCDDAGRDDGGTNSGTPTRAANYPGSGTSPASAGGNCFKCGQEGHWSRDCPNQQQVVHASNFNYQAQAVNARGEPDGRIAGNCYKCGGQGHWSNSCPNAGAPAVQSFAKSGGAGSASGGTCYKCGNPGHWANRCPIAPGGQR